jgi:hypothetical protein
VHSVRLAEKGQVEVVVHDEQGACGLAQGAQAARQGEKVPPCHDLLAELEDVRAASKCRCGQVDQAVGLQVGGDHVEPGGQEPLDEWMFRGVAKSRGN